MGKKDGIVKAKKGSNDQGDSLKAGSEQAKATVPDAVAAPKPPQTVLRLAKGKGGGKLPAEASKRAQATSGKGKESAPKNQFVKDSVKFLQSAWVELKKVHWPSLQQLVAYTIVVIFSVAVVAALIWIVDSILSKLLSYLM